MVVIIILLRLNDVGIFVLLNDFVRFGESLRISSLFVIPVELQEDSQLIAAGLMLI